MTNHKDEPAFIDEIMNAIGEELKNKIINPFVALTTRHSDTSMRLVPHNNGWWVPFDMMMMVDYNANTHSVDVVVTSFKNLKPYGEVPKLIGRYDISNDCIESLLTLIAKTYDELYKDCVLEPF